MTNSNLIFKIQPGGKLHGELKIPGDKSISHRTIMLSALAEGISEISGFLQSEDCLNTLRAFQALGVKIENSDLKNIVVHGVGMNGLKPPKKKLDLGNSGTGIRLLSGILAAQSFDSELTGDESLQKRPMKRIVDPLIKMGAKIILSENNTPPIKIFGNPGLHGIQYDMPMASAQVKSCLLLAGLFAKGKTCITEPVVTRDHTERLLKTFSYSLQQQDHQVCLEGGKKLIATSIKIPADISSAAFFIVGACIAKDSDILLTNVGINPYRTGIISILKKMGADIEMSNERLLGEEPIADIRVRSHPLKGIEIPADLVSSAIDEFPVIFIAAACAKGETILRQAQELRVKESDRIAVMAEGLHILGIKVEVLPDGMLIEGGQFHGGRIDSHGDHRVAMAFAMAGLVAKDEIVIDDCANVATSFPGFDDLAKEAGLNIYTYDTSRCDF